MPERKDWTPTKVDNVTAVSRTDGDGLWCERDGHRFCVPWKLIDDDSEVYEPGDSGTLIIPYWLVVEKEVDG